MSLPPAARAWYERATSSFEDWPVEQLQRRKAERGSRISVVVPAKNEAATIADVVSGLRRALVEQVALVDELVVMDSDSTDDTAAIAAEYGAVVHPTRSVVPESGSVPGKGEAMWKSLFVTTGDLLVFIDADLTHWGPHFVTGLLGPLLADDGVALVKGFYDRLLYEGDRALAGVGGRVTELTARPYLNLLAPELAGVVQPLAGEWAIRRAAFETLSVPTGYGVEIAAVIDTWRVLGMDAIAQVDLGRRAHVHQHDHDLSAMAAEVLHAGMSRLQGPPAGSALFQYRREVPGRWLERPVPTAERPPAISTAWYRPR